MGPDEKTYQGAIDSRRRGSILYHHSHLDPRALQTRPDGQDHQMLLWVTSDGVGRLRFIGLGTQTQGDAHLIERHVDPVGMNLDARDKGEEKPAEILRTEIVPAGGKPRSLVQQLLLCNGVGVTALDGVEDGDRIGEPCAYTAGDQSLDVGGRDALAAFVALLFPVTSDWET